MTLPNDNSDVQVGGSSSPSPRLVPVPDSITLPDQPLMSASPPHCRFSFRPLFPLWQELHAAPGPFCGSGMS